MKHVIISAAMTAALSGCSMLNGDTSFPTNPIADKSPVNMQSGIRDTHHHNIVKSFNRRGLVEPASWVRPPKPIEKSSYKPTPEIKVPSKITISTVQPETVIAKAKPCVEPVRVSLVPCVPAAVSTNVVPTLPVVSSEPETSIVTVAKLIKSDGDR